MARRGRICSYPARSMPALGMGERWAMIDSPAGPAPTSRYVPAFFPLRSTSMLSGSAAPAPNAVQAAAAGGHESFPQRTALGGLRLSVVDMPATEPPPGGVPP